MTTYEVKELTDSDNITLTRPSTNNSASRKFRVNATNLDGSQPAGLPGGALANVGVNLGDRHPSFIGLFCTSLNVRRVANHPGLYEVTVNYAPTTNSPGGPDSGGGPDSEGDVFQQSIQLNYRGKFEKLWRVDANISATPYTGGDTGEDIGGTPMDTFGEVERTTLIVKPQLQVTLQRNVDIGRNDNYLSRMQNFVGSRNNARFLGADKGKLLFLGATSRRVRDELYEISLSFEFDPAKHQEQAPQPGVGLFGKKITTSGDYKDRAFPVYWIQPYPKLMNFNSLGINLRG